MESPSSKKRRYTSRTNRNRDEESSDDDPSSKYSRFALECLEEGILFIQLDDPPRTGYSSQGSQPFHISFPFANSFFETLTGFQHLPSNNNNNNSPPKDKDVKKNNKTTSFTSRRKSYKATRTDQTNDASNKQETSNNNNTNNTKNINNNNYSESQPYLSRFPFIWTERGSKTFYDWVTDCIQNKVIPNELILVLHWINWRDR